MIIIITLWHWHALARSDSLAKHAWYPLQSWKISVSFWKMPLYGMLRSTK
jgi:hypothetical protein